MATVKLSLSSKKKQGTQESEILLRLSVDRVHVYRAKTGLYVNSKSWNAKTGRVVISRMKTVENASLAKLQSKLDALANSIVDSVLNAESSSINKEWLEAIIGEHTGKKFVQTVKTLEPQEVFENSFNLFVESQCASKRRADHFMVLLRMFKRFCVYANIQLNLDVITASQMDQFEKFLTIEHTFFDSKGKCIKHKKVYEAEPCVRTPRKRGVNAINEIMRRFRTFYKWAVRHQITRNNPFDIYKVPTCVYGTPFFLTSEERDKLFEFDFSSRPGLAVQRDIFVFQSNVGMRVGDLLELTSSNIVGDALEYVANKTRDESGRTIRVPLSKQAKTIVDRYRSKSRVELLPFISKQKYNDSIKQMLKLAGIDRVVTVLNPTTRSEEQRPIWEVASSHMARRNFIGNLYNKTQDPNAIGSMTGHVEGSKAFARYRSIDDTVKRNLVDLL